MLGFSDKEIRVYLSCLKLGESAIMPIKTDTKLPRTTVFHILERLREKGLINIVQRASRHVYLPNPPREILLMMKNQKVEIEENIASFSEQLPELNSMFKLFPFQPKVRMFVGEEIKSIYEEILDSPIEEILYVGEINKIDEIIGSRYLKNWVDRKVELKIWTRSLRIRDAESMEEYLGPDEKYLRKARFLPDNFECPSHIYIYSDSIAILTSAKENFGTVITSRDFTIAMKSWFSELWKASKEK
jgi:sugar-specific transcriptional regulator TrmB